MRANQGLSIPFVREERVAHVISTARELKARVCSVWHGTFYKSVPEILRRGLMLGGPASNRSSVYFAPLSPLDDDFGEVSRGGSETFIQIDPERLMELVPRGKVMQTANGTLLVNHVVPAAAFYCILAKRSEGPLTMIWHRSVNGMIPASVGPAVKSLQCGSWSNSSHGHWSKTTRTGPGGSQTPTSGLAILECPSCRGNLMSDSVVCES